MAAFSRALGPGPDKSLTDNAIQNWCWSLRNAKDLYEDYCPCEAPEGLRRCDTMDGFWCQIRNPSRRLRELRCTDILGYDGSRLINQSAGQFAGYGNPFHCWNGCEEFIQYCCCLGPPNFVVNSFGIPDEFMDTTTIINGDGECGRRDLFERDLNIVEFDEESIYDDDYGDEFEDVPVPERLVSLEDFYNE